jgi:hypothetical protein
MTKREQEIPPPPLPSIYGQVGGTIANAAITGEKGEMVREKALQKKAFIAVSSKGRRLLLRHDPIAFRAGSHPL